LFSTTEDNHWDQPDEPPATKKIVAQEKAKGDHIVHLRSAWDEVSLEDAKHTDAERAFDSPIRMQKG